MKPLLCLHCRREVKSITPYGYSTTWVHLDGIAQCPPTYAAPNL